jgi:hypothetical protein
MLMLVLLPTLVALFGTAVFAAIAIRSRKSARTLTGVAVVPAIVAGEARTLVGAVRRRMLLGILVGLLVTIAVASLPIDRVQTAIAIAPGVGAAFGLAALAISPFPRRVAESGLRQADLTPRGLASFGPRWGFVLPLVGAVLLVLLLIATGVSSTPDDFGRLRDITVSAPEQTNSAGPYPGWFYGVPILLAVGLLIAGLLTALHRVAGAPRIGTADVAALDSALRSALTRFVMLFGSAVVVLYLGAITLTAAAAIRSTSQWSHFKPAFLKAEEARMRSDGTNWFVSKASDTVSGVVQPNYTAGAIGAALGIVLIGVAILLALLAVSNLAIRWSVAAADREEVDA